MHYTTGELRTLGIRLGDNVSVHRTVQFFNPGAISLGCNVRIDCFCVLSARNPITIGRNVHIGAAAHIFGVEGVQIGDFAGLSSRASIFTASDDYVGGYLTNPTVPARFTNVERGRVSIGAHVIIGCGSIVMPGVILERGAAVGALSFVNRNVAEYHVVSGHPARKIAIRNAERLQMLESEYLRSGDS